MRIIREVLDQRPTGIELRELSRQKTFTDQGVKTVIAHCEPGCYSSMYEQTFRPDGTEEWVEVRYVTEET